MPYFITKEHDECKSGWAVIDDGNEIFGCHTTKKSAIDQAIAISISDDEPFNGERAAVGSLAIGDYVSWNVYDPELLGEIVMIENQLAVVRIYEEDDKIFSSTDKLVIMNVFKVEKVRRPEMVAEEIEEEPTVDANTMEPEELMITENKWLEIAKSIQQKIDGVRSESKEPEVRTNTVEFEIRELRAEDGMTFEGYASMFNSASEDLGGFIEYVAPGAFKRSLQSRNEIKLLWNHDTNEPLASVRGGSLQLTEDTRGLKVTAKLPNTTRGRDVAELIRAKVIDSMSFGFNVIKDSWSDNGQTRTLESVRLHEVSIVTYPAYQATSATVRSMPTINADDLANALLRLESGEELDETHANLITEVVNKLRQQPEVIEAEDNGLELLDLKKKQLDLLMKRI